MRSNLAVQPTYTHEGAKASHIKPIDELRRTVLACLLWEDNFYESGASVADRIKALVPKCVPHDVADIAIEAREKQRLRHAPLLLVRELARLPQRAPDGLIANTLSRVIQRADELAEFVALYWRDGKAPLSKQVKRGLAAAFTKFDEYALAKYNRDAAVKLRDVLFLVHAKPANDSQAALWKRLVDGSLATPDTWEVALSGGADKREAFERMLREGRLGYMALLRNLRNMRDAGVSEELVFGALMTGAAKSKALPFRFVAAARAVPQWEPTIDQAMMLAARDVPKLSGKTIVLVDVSGSMEAKLSAKSDLSRLDAACALAVLASVACESVAVLSFSDRLAQVPPRAGMALIDAIKKSQKHSGTWLGAAIAQLAGVECDRIIVVTDEQSHDSVGKPNGRGYMINVATNKNGVGYGDWTHITGWSESVIGYISASEAERSK